MINLDHDTLGEIAAKKLKAMGYHFAFSNMRSSSMGEQPDALGINQVGESFLVEAKVSRADFFADQKKPWRQNPKLQGMGDFRAYITPAGLLNPDEIPYGWQLWEVHGKTKPVIKIIKGQRIFKVKHERFGWSRTQHEYVNCSQEEYLFFCRKWEDRRENMAELGWLMIILRRAQLSGIDLQQFSSSSEIWDQRNG